ncbi:MAG: YitT family protein [Spirochaetaceae bacterium]|nr:YitT family protein [Spirochaetaceae bacterium]
MSAKPKKIYFNWLISICITALGSLCVASGLYFFLVPTTISPGGVSGLSVVLNRLTGIPVYLLNLCINIPLFLFGAKLLGKKCAFLTFEATILLSVFLAIFEWTTPVDVLNVQSDMTLASIFGGLCVGLGLGLVFKVGGTTGGTDLVGAIINHHFPNLSIAQGMAVIDLVIVVLAGVVTQLPQVALYSLIALFFCMKIPDMILDGFNYYKGFIIITHEPEKTGNALMEELSRGVTILKGAGMYSKQDKPLLLCVVHRAQFTKAKEIINTYDSTSFIMVMNMKEVFGNGFISPDTKT